MSYGRAPRGARGLKCPPVAQVPRRAGRRAPRGARGLKFFSSCEHTLGQSCRAPRGARGLKFFCAYLRCLPLRRAPRGARGLKCQETNTGSGWRTSRPSRGAWIEIVQDRGLCVGEESRPSRGAWIEIPIELLSLSFTAASRPSRGAWIEIKKYLFLRF